MPARIVLFADPSDPHAVALRRALRRRGLSSDTIDPQGFAGRTPLALRVSDGDAPEPRLGDVPLEAVRAGWIGASLSVPSARRVRAQSRPFAQAAVRQTLRSWLRACPFPWMNDPDAATRADDKFFQLVAARREGFEIPNTLVTNDPKALRRFHGAHAKIVAKSPSGSDGLPDDRRILTTLVEKEDLANAADLRYAPVILQEYVEKSTELRVTVVGDRVFAVRIHSQNSERTRVDWRRYGPNLEYSKAQVPARVAARCVRVARRVGLGYGGIDLIHTPDGRFVFLEINSRPAWWWVEDETGLPIAQALADRLRRIGRMPTQSVHQRPRPPARRP